MCENCDKIVNAIPEEKKDNWFELMQALIGGNTEYIVSPEDKAHTKRVLEVVNKAQELRDFHRVELQTIFEAIAFIAGMNDILPTHLKDSVDSIYSCVISFRCSSDPAFREKYEKLKAQFGGRDFNDDSLPTDAPGFVREIYATLKAQGYDVSLDRIGADTKDEKFH